MAPLHSAAAAEPNPMIAIAHAVLDTQRRPVYSDFARVSEEQRARWESTSPSTATEHVLATHPAERIDTDPVAL